MARWPFSRRRPAPTGGGWSAVPPIVPVTRAANPLVAAPYFAMPDIAGSQVVVALTPLPPDVDGAPHPVAEDVLPEPGAESPWGARRDLAPDDAAGEPPAAESLDDGSDTDGQDLAGLIAMFDAEVRRGAMLRGVAAESPPEPPRATVMRPTLSASRRRGIQVRQPTEKPPVHAHLPARGESADGAAEPLEPPFARTSRADSGGPQPSAVAELPDQSVEPPVRDTEPPAGVRPSDPREGRESDRGPSGAEDSADAAPSQAVGSDGLAGEPSPAAPATDDDGDAPSDDGSAEKPAREADPSAWRPTAATTFAPERVADAAHQPLGDDVQTEPDTEPFAAAALGTIDHDRPPGSQTSHSVRYVAMPVTDRVTEPSALPQTLGLGTRLPGTSEKSAEAVERAAETDEAEGTYEPRAAPPEPKAPAADPDARSQTVERAERVWPTSEVGRREIGGADAPADKTVEAEALVPALNEPGSARLATGQAARVAQSPGHGSRRPADDPEAVPTWFGAPSATVALFSRMTEVDLGFVPVVRGSAASTEAGRLDARAFTRAGIIHLPDEAGPVESRETQALIVHELAHVLQQRALGPLAAEDGPLGQAMEAQADAVERAVLEEPVDPGDWRWPADVADAMPVGLSWTPETGFESPSAAGARERGDQPPGPEGSRPRRAPVGTPAPIGPGAGASAETGKGDATVPLAYPDMEATSETLELPVAPVAQPPPVHPLSEVDVVRVADRVRAGLVLPELDPKDPDLLDVLATGLYGRLRTSLRSELIADRERAGILTEFH